jgi:hypothetical protein
MRRLALLLVPCALFAAQPRYARLGEFTGRVEVQLRASDAWMPAERNLPLPEGAWVRTGATPASRVELEFDEGNAWRVGPDSQFEISDYTTLSTAQRVTTISLDRGLAYLTGQAEGRDSLVVALPGAHITVTRGTRVRLEVQEQWSQIAVIEGTVRFSSAAAEMDLREGQTTRVEPANAARFFLYREVSPMELDRWSEERDKTLETSTSAAHVVQRYGLSDLDAGGEWVQTEEFGPVWKPKTADGWAPYQKGRWRWYDELGYTWVSDDEWGWLPYHYGRWTRSDNLGWIWVPATNTIFKPGEVYWLRAPRFAGWGPLAPGEQWNGSAPPQQFVNANTTYASFQQDVPVIDPAGFTGRPRDPVAATTFALALPSPALPAARLDAVRPYRRGVNGHIRPVIDEVRHDGAQPLAYPPPQQPPVVVVTDPAPPPPPPDPTAYPVPVPVPVGILVVNPPGNPDYSRRPRNWPGVPSSPGQGKQPASTTTATPAGTASTAPTIAGVPPLLGPKPRVPDDKMPKSGSPPNQLPKPPAASRTTMPPAGPQSPPATVNPGRADSPDRSDKRVPNLSQHFTSLTRPEKSFRGPGESELLNKVLQDLNGGNHERALASLESWTQKYHDSDFGDDRAYYYMQVYNALNQPAKVLESASPLMVKDLRVSFAEPLQVLGVLYLATLNVQKLTSPAREQTAVGRSAAYGLLSYLPVCFAAENRPAAVSPADWTKARNDLEALARQTLKR